MASTCDRASGAEMDEGRKLSSRVFQGCLCIFHLLPRSNLPISKTPSYKTRNKNNGLVFKFRLGKNSKVKDEDSIDESVGYVCAVRFTTAAYIPQLPVLHQSPDALDTTARGTLSAPGCSEGGQLIVDARSASRNETPHLRHRRWEQQNGEHHSVVQEDLCIEAKRTPVSKRSLPDRQGKTCPHCCFPLP